MNRPSTDIFDISTDALNLTIDASHFKISNLVFGVADNLVDINLFSRIAGDGPKQTLLAPPVPTGIGVVYNDVEPWATSWN